MDSFLSVVCVVYLRQNERHVKSDVPNGKSYIYNSHLKTLYHPKYNVILIYYVKNNIFNIILQTCDSFLFRRHILISVV